MRAFSNIEFSFFFSHGQNPETTEEESSMRDRCGRTFSEAVSEFLGPPSLSRRFRNKRFLCGNKRVSVKLVSLREQTFLPPPFVQSDDSYDGCGPAIFRKAPKATRVTPIATPTIPVTVHNWQVE